MDVDTIIIIIRLGRDDIYCIMLALLKTRHSSMEYRNTVLDAFLDKVIVYDNIR